MGQEYTLLGKLFILNALTCYLYNAIQLLLLSAFVVAYLRKFVSAYWACVSALLMFVSPGFITAWFRLAVSDRDALFWLVVTLYSNRLFVETGRWRWLLVTTVSANLALYYKEVVFAALATFSAFELLGASARRNRTRRHLGYIVMLMSSVVFLLGYYMLIARHVQGNYANERRFTSTLDNQIFCLRAYALMAYPALFFLVIPAALSSLLSKVARRRFADIGTLDSLGLETCSYILMIFILNLPIGIYYLLPAYAFGLAPVASRMSSLKTTPITINICVLSWIITCVACAIPTTWVSSALGGHGMRAVVFLMVILAVGIALRGRFGGSRWPLASAVVFTCVIGNQLPETVNALASWKYGPWKFQELLSELHDLVRRNPTSKPRIFILESDRNLHVEYYTSIGEYLRSKLAIGSDFDLDSELPAGPKFRPNPVSPYTVFRDSSPGRIRPGDLLIGINPSRKQMSRFSRLGRFVYRSQRPNYTTILSADELMQKLKSRYKKIEHDDSAGVDFCILVAK